MKNDIDNIREQLSAFLDGELPPEEAMRVQHALDEDVDLADELEQLRATRELVGRLPRVAAPDGFTERVVSHAERLQLLRRPLGGGPYRSFRWITMAAAAVVLLSVGLGMLIVMSSLSPETPPSTDGPVTAAKGEPDGRMVARGGETDRDAYEKGVTVGPRQEKGGSAGEANLGRILASIPKDLTALPKVSINTDNLADVQRDVELLLASNGITAARGTESGGGGLQVCYFVPDATAAQMNALQSGLKAVQRRQGVSQTIASPVAGELKALAQAKSGGRLNWSLRGAGGRMGGAPMKRLGVATAGKSAAAPARKKAPGLAVGRDSSGSKDMPAGPGKGKDKGDSAETHPRATVVGVEVAPGGPGVQIAARSPTAPKPRPAAKPSTSTDKEDPTRRGRPTKRPTPKATGQTGTLKTGAGDVKKEPPPPACPPGEVVARAVTPAPSAVRAAQGGKPSDEARPTQKGVAAETPRGEKAPAVENGLDRVDAGKPEAQPKPKPAPKVKRDGDTDKLADRTAAGTDEETRPKPTRPTPPAALVTAPVTAPPTTPVPRTSTAPAATRLAKVQVKEKLKGEGRLGETQAPDAAQPARGERSWKEGKLRVADSGRVAGTSGEGSSKGRQDDDRGTKDHGTGRELPKKPSRSRRPPTQAGKRAPAIMWPFAAPPPRDDERRHTATAPAERTAPPARADKKEGEANLSGYKHRLAATGGLLRSASTRSAEKRMLVITVSFLPLNADTMSRRAAAERAKAGPPPTVTDTEK